MPLIEVDDVTLSAMRDNRIAFADKTQDSKVAQAVLSRISKLESGPRRQRYLELLKEEFPDLTIPEVDAAKPVRDDVAALSKRFDDYLEGQAKDREERSKRDDEERANKTVSQGRSWLRSKQKLDDEGVKAIEDLMTDRGIADYEAAFHLWNANRPPPAVELPNSVLGNSLDWFKHEEGRPDKDLLLKDPMMWRKQQSGKLLADIRAGRIDEFGRPTNRAA